MSFPQTRLTLVQRLASGGTEDDWRQFVTDYWGPICRFSLRWGARNLDDAEEVASETFEALWQQRLLVRWVSNRSAKLRTLLCCVVRNMLSHRNRVRTSREQRLREVAERIAPPEGAADEHVDMFYVAWVEDVVQRAVESMAAEYCRKGQVDYVRVLYGRLCQNMTIAQTAEALNISDSAVDHYFRHARARLGETLEELVRGQVRNYARAEEADDEFALEWRRLGDYLSKHGGLEQTMRRAYECLDPAQAKQNRGAGLARTMTRLTSIIRTSSDVNR